MKHANLVANGIIVVLAATIITGLFESEFTATTVENIFLLAGIGYLVFGIWAVVLLKKNKK